MKYLDLLEQIELVEAAKDKYAPMFAFFEEITPYLENSQGFQRVIKEKIEWATRVLSTSERVVYFLRYVRLYILKFAADEMNAIYKEFKEYETWDASTEQFYPELTTDPDAAREFADWIENRTGHTWGAMPIFRRKKWAILFSREKGMPIHASIWKDLEEKLAVYGRGIEAAIQRVQKLYQRDMRKMVQKGAADGAIYSQKMQASYEPIRDKYTKVKAECDAVPDGPNCGNTLDELMLKYELASNLLSGATRPLTIDPAAIEEHFKNNEKNGWSPTIDSMQERLAHYDSINYDPMNEFTFGWLTWPAINNSLYTLETYWADKASRIIAHDEDQENIEKIMDFGDGMAWWNLHREYCAVEGSAMGHCGNEYENRREADEVLSLREYIGVDENGHEEWKPHLTFIYDSERGKLSEMKGHKNHKPEARYHKYIVPLLEQDWVQGIYTRRGQHEKENNFYISDLPEDVARRLAAEKPALVTMVDMKKLKVEGDPEVEEEDPREWNADQINDQLHSWGIEAIEYIDSNDDIILSFVGKTVEEVYNELSSGSWPDSSDVDYIDDEALSAIASKFSGALVSDITEYVVREYFEESLDVAGMDEPDTEEEDFDWEEFYEEVEDSLGFSGAYSVLKDANDNIIKNSVQEAWEEAHVADMRRIAEFDVNDLSDQLEQPFNFGEIDGKYAFYVDKDLFFDKVWDNLATHPSSYGTTYWSSYIKDARLSDVIENYWEGLQYEGFDHANSYIARQAENKIGEKLRDHRMEKRRQKEREAEDRLEQEEARQKSDLISDKMNMERETE